MKTRVYIHMNEAWFSYTFNQWKSFVDSILAQGKDVYEGFSLDENHYRRNRPKLIVKHSDGSFGTDNPRHIVLNGIIDWEYDDFEAHAETCYRY